MQYKQQFKKNELTLKQLMRLFYFLQQIEVQF